jgi:hypothetical protein
MILFPKVDGRGRDPKTLRNCLNTVIISTLRSRITSTEVSILRAVILKSPRTRGSHRTYPTTQAAESSCRRLPQDISRTTWSIRRNTINGWTESTERGRKRRPTISNRQQHSTKRTLLHISSHSRRPISTSNPLGISNTFRVRQIPPCLITSIDRSRLCGLKLTLKMGCLAKIRTR